jgi:hypothetical protein
MGKVFEAARARRHSVALERDTAETLQEHGKQQEES